MREDYKKRPTIDVLLDNLLSIQDRICKKLGKCSYCSESSDMICKNCSTQFCLTCGGH